jgi:hypothetical protein
LSVFEPQSTAKICIFAANKRDIVEKYCAIWQMVLYFTAIFLVRSWFFSFKDQLPIKARFAQSVFLLTLKNSENRFSIYSL